MRVFKILLAAVTVVGLAVLFGPVYAGFGIFAVGAMLTRDLATPRRSHREPLYDHIPLAAGVTVYAGSLGEIVGGLLQPAGTAGTGFAPRRTRG